MSMPVARRQLLVFSAACLVIFSYLLVSLFYTLPSNALSSRHSKGARQYFNTVTPQVWAFFTKNPEGIQIGFYGLKEGKGENLLRTPQGNPSNLFGLERSQRAQGPEVSYLEAAVPNWIECSGTLERCLPRAAETPAAKLENRSPVQTLCGDSFITQESVVPWSYRDLVKYDRRITKIAHLDVSCP
ncbi:SdpA family antimicrobial peptide system protein [Streptomyces sp. NBC_01443]|uniref:SdpA family antimicrobial peptide system protein n=1 Tax=Streptomyces sp. NBC_01443 TaxID=2903868 RepID=UPI0022552873|nr:SdpA family antimicrobial peptide system protein [Streptomyces sp. NBC_01443]MCX4631358.1 SdpA family antimicrobial peptide system protein [Streptomyces sp. NBC_01443]